MAETRKLAAILAADIVGYSRLTSVDEDRTLARVRALRAELFDPVIAANRGRVVKRTGDGAIVEFRSVVDAVRCADRNPERDGRAQRRLPRRPADRLPHRHSCRRRRRGRGRRPDGRRRQHRRAAWRASPSPARSAFPRTPIGRSRAARPQGQRPRADDAQEYRRAGARLFPRSRRAGRERSPRLRRRRPIAKPPASKGRWARRRSRAAIAALLILSRPARGGSSREPSRSVARTRPRGRASFDRRAALRQSLRRSGAGLFRRRHHREPDHRPLAHPRQLRDRAQHGVHLQGQDRRRQGRSARNSAFATCSKARCSATRIACGSTRSSSTPKRRASLGRPLRGGHRGSVQAAGSGGGAIGQCVGYELVKAEADKGAARKIPDAIDLAMRGWAVMLAAFHAQQRPG